MPMLSLSLSTVALVLLPFWTVSLDSVSATGSSSPPPTVTLPSQDRGGRSDTKTAFVGRYLSGFNLDVVLGIKYADEHTPFTPSGVKTSYDDVGRGDGMVDATAYGFHCPGYGADEDELQELGWSRVDEDCLHLNRYCAADGAE